MKAGDLIDQYDKLMKEIADIEKTLFKLCAKSSISDKVTVLNNSRKDERHSVKLLLKELDRHNSELETLKNINITIQH